MSLVISALLVLAIMTAVTVSRPVANYPTDREGIATGYDGNGHGRVHISVHRGPTKGHGHYAFAPFAYYVKQPEDDHGH